MKKNKENKNAKTVISLMALALISAFVLSSCGNAALAGKTIVNAADDQSMTVTGEKAMVADEKIPGNSMVNQNTDMDKEVKADESIVGEEMKSDGNSKTDDVSMNNDITMEKNFSLPDIMGNTVNLSDYAGKKVYIKFWATWCPICLGGLDEFIQLNTAMADQENTVILTIVSPGTKGEMTNEDFIAWFEKQGYSFPVLLDQGGNVARDFNVRGYPTSVFIDTNGKIAQSRPGHVGNEDIKTILAEMK